MALAMQPASQKVIQDPKGNKRIENVPPKPEAAEKWLHSAMMALDAASKADIMGDRPLARETPAKG